MSQGPGAPKPLPPGNTLPPVEAPNAGFILQLFVIPGLIVLTIFVIVGLLRLLAQTPSDPRAYITDIGKGGEAGWRAAVNLANLMHDSGQNTIKRDPQLASELAAILDRELANGGSQQMEDNAIHTRFYLCRALGEFQVDTGAELLLKAATTRRDDAEVVVQQAAIAALAVLASNVKEASGEDLSASHPKVVETLIVLSHDKDDLLRSSAAYTLGIVGGDVALKRLEQMIDDEAYPDALYNAATGLARHGNAKAVDVLVEMLDPEQARGVAVEKQENPRDYKRAMIVLNGLRATSQLADANSTADLSRLTTAIEKLLQTKLDAQTKVEAGPVLAKLKRRASPGGTAP